MSLPHLRRFLERNHITTRALSRALDRTPTFIIRLLTQSACSLETVRDIETVLKSSGYTIPRNLWINSEGSDVRTPDRQLFTLADHRVAKPMPGQPGFIPFVNRTQLSFQKILQGENPMQALTAQAREHFDLKLDPFRDEIRKPEDIWWSREHKRALDAMNLAVPRQSFVAIIGEIGFGKTTIKRVFFDERPENVRIIEPIFPDKRAMTPNNILDAIIFDLAGPDANIKLPSGREKKARRVREMLEALETGGQTATLILEDAHLFTISALKSLKLLHEMERGFAKLLSIILIGQLELFRKLNDPTIREIQQRCSQLVMRGLGNQTEEYLRHKFSRVGGKLDRVLHPTAIVAIQKLCRHKVDQVDEKYFGPYPLHLGVVISAAMNYAARHGEKLVTAEVIDRAWGTSSSEDRQ